MKNQLLLIGAIFALSLNTFSQTLNERSLTELAGKTVSYPIKFAVLGDSQQGTDGYADNLQPILDDIVLEGPDFAICCGDITQSGTTSEFITFDNLITPLIDNHSIPFFCLPGNHDIYDGNFSRYQAKIGPNLDYTFDFGNLRFMLINNVRDGMDYGINSSGDPSNPETLELLESWMSSMEDNGLNGYILAHIPLYDEGYNACGIDPNCIKNTGGQSTSGPEPNFDVLHELNKQYQIKAFISGHNHYFQHGYADPSADGDYGDGNIEYFVTGGAAEVITYPDPSECRHWLLFEVYECGQTVVEVKRVGCNAQSNDNLPELQCQANYNLSNETENGNQKYYAEESITASNSYIIANDANVEFTAGNHINLEVGFQANENAYFTAQLCSSLECLPQVKDSKESTNRNAETVDVNKESNDNNIGIYPNPTNGIMTVKIPQSENLRHKILIYNTSGKIIKELYSNKENTNIDISNHPNGIYHIKIQSETNKYQTTIIKQ